MIKIGSRLEVQLFYVHLQILLSLASWLQYPLILEILSQIIGLTISAVESIDREIAVGYSR